MLTKQDLLQAKIIGYNHQVAGFSTPCKSIVKIANSALSNTLSINGDSTIIAQQISQIFTDNGVPLQFKNGATPKAKDIFELDEDIAVFDNAQNGNENAESISKSSLKSSEDLDIKSNEIFIPLPQRYASNDDMAIYEDFISNTKRHTTKKYPLAHSPLADLIVSKESNDNYNIANRYNTDKDKYLQTNEYILTTMTLKEVMLKQKDIKLLYAAGRYQIIPETLKGAKNALNLNENDLFNEEMQDRIFEEYLIDKKRPDVMEYLKGNGDIDKAAYELAKEFASIGVKRGLKLANGQIAKGGESYYNKTYNKAFHNPEKVIIALKDTKEQYKDYIKGTKCKKH